MNVSRLARALVLAALVLTLAGCGDDSAEARLRQVIAQAEQTVETRDLAGLAAFVSRDYRDEQGLDKRGIVRVLIGYLLRHRNIHLFSRIQAIDWQDDQRHAQVMLLVAMADVPVDSMQTLRSLRADLHRFELRFIDGADGWQLTSARWRRARLDEILATDTEG